jgi:hypothetical protein
LQEILALFKAFDRDVYPTIDEDFRKNLEATLARWTFVLFPPPPAVLVDIWLRRINQPMREAPEF